MPLVKAAGVACFKQTWVAASPGRVGFEAGAAGWPVRLGRGVSMRPNVALVASNAPNAALGALDAPNATLGRMAWPLSTNLGR